MKSFTSDQIVLFAERLKQVVLWTDQLADGFDFKNGDYGAIFRQINTVISDQEAFKSDDDGYTIWNLDDYNKSVYNDLIEQAYSIRASYSDMKIEDLDDKGRILVFKTGITTHDGIAIIESEFFVDESDTPPIDT